MAWMKRKYHVEIYSNVKKPIIPNSSNEDETKTKPNKIAWDKKDVKMSHSKIFRYPSKKHTITFLKNWPILQTDVGKYFLIYSRNQVSCITRI